MAFLLKDYQQRCLDVLREYLDSARAIGPELAFLACRGDDVPQGYQVAYRRIPGLDGVPYVCVRVPTGGGKTLLAAHSVSVVGQTYLDQEAPLVVWFVPTRTIQAQTVGALKDTKHPYRRALDEAFQGSVRVFDIAETSLIRPPDLFETTCIIVTTLAAIRVEDVHSRQFYAHNENFESFFAALPGDVPDLERDGEGRVLYSFSNILNLRRPLVIIDEAHNARTSLTFASLQRIRPGCIVEFTATPDRDVLTGSNVLISVSAIELRDAQMIKLPIVLTEHLTWEDAVHAAIVERSKLSEVSRNSGDTVRPVVLFQAQAKDGDVSVDVLLDHLKTNEGIPRERIAIATGHQRELDGINLFDPTCRIDFIITVAALREGWDCSYAYVLCSVADLRSATAVEQLLGRVLRMPLATRRAESALNKAYAHVVSRNFIDAAEALQDCLVDRLGFDPSEFLEAVEPKPISFLDKEVGIDSSFRQVTIELPGAPQLTLPAEGDATISCVETGDGKYHVTISGPLGPAIRDAILEAAPPTDRPRIQFELEVANLLYPLRSPPVRRGEELAIPLLSVKLGDAFELAEPQLFLDWAQWDLLSWPAVIPGFHFSPDTQSWIYDLVDSNGQTTVAYKLIDRREEDLLLPGLYAGWSEADLIRWLDRRVRDESTPQLTMLEWLRRLLTTLIRQRGYSLETLVRAKFILATAVRKYVELCKKRTVAAGYQGLLFGPSAAPQVTFDFEVRFPGLYSPSYCYSGRQLFSRHYYPQVGELKNDGEELECAKVIDSLPEVNFWIRNLERRPTSFWLPTSTDKFYPDFICALADKRTLVVEYKGEVYKTTDDSAEKRGVGKLWADLSGGKCLFIMAVKNDAGRDMRQQILETIRPTR